MEMVVFYSNKSCVIANITDERWRTRGS